MALNSQNQILASDFVSLKARVKAEMNRRRYSGSLTSYAGTAYDYTENPTSGGVIKPEHANKLIIPGQCNNSKWIYGKKHWRCCA